MIIEKKKISELIPAPYNPRQSTKKQEADLKRSLEKFGVVEPIIFNQRSGYIVGGHFRIRELKKLGYKEVDCVIVDLSDEDEKELNIRLNANTGEWEWEQLQNDWDQVKLEEWGLDVPDEWSVEDLPPEEGQDEVPELKTDPFVARGDIFEIKAQGLKYRIGCLDSTSIDDIEKLMDGKKANMVFTDPPYNMKMEGSVHADGSKSYNSIHGAIKNDKMSDKEFQEFLDSFGDILNLYVKGAFYITFYRLGIDWMFDALNRKKLKVRNLIIWKKNNFNLSNSDYKSFYEPMFYGWINEHNFYGEKGEVDIWEINKTKVNDLHPTMKPIELCERAINNSSKQKDNILDLFAGSGSTLIACIKTKRNCYTCDIDEHYTQVTVKRAVDFMNKNDIEFNITLNGQEFDINKLNA